MEDDCRQIVPPFEQVRARQRKTSIRSKNFLPYHETQFLQQNRNRTKALLEAIQQQGYSGSYRTLNRYVQHLRQLQAAEWKKELPLVIGPQQPALSARRATWLVLRHPQKRSHEDGQLLTHLIAQHPEVSTAIELAQGFTHLVRHYQPEALDAWLNQAKYISLVPFQRFAQTLQQDYDALKAGITSLVSNSPTEGHINRLKMLKRQMYSRAGIELLSRRFLLD